MLSAYLGLAFSANADVQTGFVDIRYDESKDKVFLRVKKSMLDQDFIFQSSLPHGVGSNDIGLDRGQLGRTRLAEFVRFGNKVMLNQLNTKYRSSSVNLAENESIDEAFADSILAGFIISEETDTYLEFDYTQFLFSDIHNMADRLKARNQGTFKPDAKRSGVYLPRTKAFPLNTELEAVVTFAGQAKGQFIKDVTPDPQSVTVHMHHSFIQLPDDKFTPRAFHPYSGYSKHSFFDYSVPIDAEMEQKYIRRHRLEKKQVNASMSEAVEPIVYYLDPGIPEPVYSALRDGALWWNQAFEAAGFKNAFQVKRLPDGADPMDVRYNIIQWVHRATRGWSYGFSVVDPRTGEILKGHVTLGSLRVRQDFLIALGMTSPFADKNASTEEQLQMALNRIKQLSAHEVGHTLGIAHNFAASENNRASVMDYPHPYITLKKGGIDLSQAYDDKIGDWDKYVVKYGYSTYLDETSESQALAALVSEAQQTFKYKSDPDARSSNRPSADGHLWDNGADPVKEFERVLAVRDFALDNFGSQSLPFGHAWSDLEERLVPIYYSHRYQLDALIKQVGGINYQYALKERHGNNPQVRFVAGETQKQALSLALKSASAEFLRLPENIVALIPPKTYGTERTRESSASRMGRNFDPIALAESAAASTIYKLLTAERVNRLDYQSKLDDSVPSVEFLIQSVFTELVSKATSSGLEARVGLIGLRATFDLLEQKELAPELALLIKAELLAYGDNLKKQRKNAKAKVLLRHLDTFWETGQFPMEVSVKPMPPGSPI
ncbi:zinc-dependent metalloprotease [Agaribacter flavus]